MATIGTVTKHDDGHYEGELRTLSIRADITILPVTDKAAESQPDFRVLPKGVEIGAGWARIGQPVSRKTTSARACRTESSLPWANIGSLG
jgi:uncharacterized protein (DUF736 family)